MINKNMKPIIHYYNSPDYSDSGISSAPSSIPSLDHHGDSVSSRFPVQTPNDSTIYDSQSSLSTYRSSTESSFTEVDSEYDEEEDQGTPYAYNQASYFKEPVEERAVPATPSEFAELFPTTKRLMIKHDDSASDGDMNLRVDIKGMHGHRVTLFHARIYDLRDRDVSIRRYGRDCGREVAHAKRRFEKPSPQKRRPALTKAFTTFRGKNENPLKSIQRQDSGYSSAWDEEDEEEFEVRDAKGGKATNSCSLEFANYAHVDLTRRGGKANKKYDFEYWGSSYSWKRTLGEDDIVSYGLVNNNTGSTVARMSPDPDGRIIEGFIRPYSLFFKDCKQDPVSSARCDVYE